MVVVQFKDCTKLMQIALGPLSALVWFHTGVGRWEDWMVQCVNRGKRLLTLAMFSLQMLLQYSYSTAGVPL